MRPEMYWLKENMIQILKCILGALFALRFFGNGKAYPGLPEIPVSLNCRNLLLFIILILNWSVLMKRWTKNDYKRGIDNLRLAAEQLEPDGNCCSICGDNDHQAWECIHNPLNIHFLDRTHWRCYHCDSIFTDSEAARKHFGNISTAIPKCIRDKCLCLECSNNPTHCKGPCYKEE